MSRSAYDRRIASFTITIIGNLGKKNPFQLQISPVGQRIKHSLLANRIRHDALVLR